MLLKSGEITPLGLFLILQFFGSISGLRLTNMTAPALQDPRHDMELHCRFDMGGEDLYAVKWYKDDHEFFRYTPTAKISHLQFPVDGVKVKSDRSRCMKDGCDLLLTELSRPQSSGAYRCEVSSEAPAFRLASQTHNVTVAALPNAHPKIEGLSDTYLIDDLLMATCSSGLGDPKPSLTWYVNKKPVPLKSVRELPSETIEQNNGRVKLKSSIIQLKLPLDKELTKNRPKIDLEITCTSSLDGINPAVSPPKNTTKVIMVIDQNLIVSNEKLHSPLNGTNQRGLQCCWQHQWWSLMVLILLVLLRC